MSDSVQPHGQQPTRLLYPWDSPGKSTGVGCHFLLHKYTDDTTLIAESEEELKSLLMKVKEENESWLKAQHSENKDHGIRSHHFMGNRWGNSGNSG